MIRPIKPFDIPGLNRLSPPEWNMDYEAFLRGFLNDPFFHGFISVKDGKPVSTGNVLIKDGVGWLANIIVDKDYRNQGLGYQMTLFLLDILDQHQCTTKLLLATELGAYVYKKLGFIKTTDYRGFTSLTDQPLKIPNGVRKLLDSDLSKVHQLDLTINGENRIHLLSRFYQDGFGYFNTKNELVGCYLPNFGRGLVLSNDSKIGIELLKIKHAKKGQKTLIPLENKVGIDFFVNGNFEEDVTTARMVLGKENDWKPTSIYSYASGYCG